MAIRILRASERTATAWKNGGGVTREIAAGPAGAGMADFDWRISLADVTDSGPFSGFREVDRIITTAQGQGMELSVAGAPAVVIEPFEPFAFPGDAETGCRLLAGPVVNLNVMTRRGRASATVHAVHGVHAARPGRDLLALEAPTGGAVLAVALAGPADLTPHGLHLDRWDAALLTDGSTAALRTQELAAVVTLHGSDLA
ncbi:HutD family protein [Streptomyces sp. NPDC059373]